MDAGVWKLLFLVSLGLGETLKCRFSRLCVDGAFVLHCRAGPGLSALFLLSLSLAWPVGTVLVVLISGLACQHCSCYPCLWPGLSALFLLSLSLAWPVGTVLVILVSGLACQHCSCYPCLWPGLSALFLLSLSLAWN